VYTRQSPSGNDIILTQVRDSQLTMSPIQLTTTRNNTLPQWSPDGTYITFVSRRDGNQEVYRMLIGGQEQTNLTQDEAIDVSPSWQPPALTP
jgi:Tol biopolymer transport system component